MGEKIKQVLSSEQLLIEADGSLFVVPRASIECMQIYPAPTNHSAGKHHIGREPHGRVVNPMSGQSGA